MALGLCGKHAAELEKGFIETGTAEFKTKTPEEMERRMEQKMITADTFDPWLASMTMMLASLSMFYGVPPEVLERLDIGINCPACKIIELGNPDVIKECVEECHAEAIRLGLLPAS